MNKKIIGILIITLLITTAIPAIGIKSDSKVEELYNNDNIAYVKIFEQPPSFDRIYTSDAYFGAKFKVYEGLWNVDGDFVKLTWWGIALQWTGSEYINGTPEGMNFYIDFYDDVVDPYYAPPVELIKSFDFSAEEIEIIYTGEYYLSPITGQTYELIRFDSLLPSPFNLPDGDGWISIQSYNDTENDVFLWMTSNGFDNFSYQVHSTDPELEYDMSICFYREDLSPEELIITGEVNIKAGAEYEYTFVATDPEGDEISYFIDWGDNNNSGWLGPYSSGIEISAKHNWSEQGEYIIKAKAKDSYGAESDWITYEVDVTKSKSYLPFGFIFVFGFDVDVKIVQLEPGEDYVDLEVLSKPFYIWENGIQTRNPGEFIRLYNATGLFSPSLPFCFGICDDWGIIG